MGHGMRSARTDTQLSLIHISNTGTDVANPEYKNCTIINKDGESVKYGNEGKILPTLLLSVAPTSSLALPGELTLTATLSGAVSGNSGNTLSLIHI